MSANRHESNRRKHRLDAVILLPTYNEAENIGPILEQVFKLEHDIGVVVLDDGSPDGTGGIVTGLCGRYPWLALLENDRKEGLGPAYLRGFRHVLEHIDAEFVFEMDADFSHDPSYIPVFLEVARQRNLDLVLGSRYMRGGDTPDWDLRRMVLSRTANLYCRAVLGADIHDYTTGYRCYRTDALRRVDLSRVASNGYGFQIEMACLFKRRGLRVGEVPIVFPDRKLGKSKMHGGIVGEALFLVMKLGWQRVRAGCG